MEISNLLKIMEKALEVPSEKCLMDKEHKYEFFIHANEKDYSSYYYQCETCEEIVVQKLKKSW